MSVDASSRVFLAWNDYRGFGFSHIYVTQLLPDGTLAPGWPADGLPVSAFPGYQFAGDILADGRGGVFIAGEYDGGNSPYGFLQHIGADGRPVQGWNASGVMLTTIADQFDPRLAPDGTGGVIVVWENRTLGLIYAQRFSGDGVVSTALALASADAQPDRVNLVWQWGGASVVTATVERRSDGETWQSLGEAAPEGSDRLHYEDREVVPGHRYAYRLRYLLGGVATTTGDSWVDVPLVAQLKITGLRPNPGTGANLQVAFTLPNSAPARLELLDIAGRRIAEREVGSLGAGSHVEPLGAGARVPAGLYWLRLTQGGRALVTRAVVAG
jgi:hypothetical protein